MPLLRNISELAICDGNVRQQDAGLIRNAALVWQGQKIVWVGPSHELPTQYENEAVTDCKGGLVIPGLVDCHTHLCFGGWRENEFEQRLRGISYQQISEQGGGIKSTVSATHGESMGDLLRKTLNHLNGMMDLGVTTVECKSGYGLDEPNELKQLEVYRRAALQHPMSLIPTFLGAHTVPAEYSSDRSGYVRLLCEKLIPLVAERGLARFCDVFVERGAFNIAEARQIMDSAKRAGLGLKVHADQLSDSGAAAMAAEVGAVSAEHLEYVSENGIKKLAKAGVVAVSLPFASVYLREKQTPARALLDAGVAVAVATDFNPGSAPSYHLPLAMMLACLQQQMTPQEVIKAVTSVAAKAVDQQHRIGSLKAGYVADITIIDSPSISSWLYHFRGNACSGVIKAGNWTRRGGEIVN